MENKIKNMEYWKKKNNIPGIDGAKDSGLTDGRAGSAPFQMATPGSSPNKGWLQNLGQGLIGKGKLGFMNPLMWAGRGIKNTLDNDPTTTNIFGGGANPNATMAAGAVIPQPAMAAQPLQTAVGGVGSAMTMKKSPMKQQDEEKLIAGQFLKPGEEPGTYIDEQEGKGYTDPDGYIEIDDEGNVVDNDYKYIVNEENVIIGVKEPGEEEREPVGPMGPGGMDIRGGVGIGK